MILSTAKQSGKSSLSGFLSLVVLVLVFVGNSCGSRNSLAKALRESAPADSVLSQGYGISSDSMTVLEQTQLAEQELQNIYVGGVWYQRFLGDMQFREIDGYDYDNLRDFPRNTVFDVVLDLRDSTHFALAQVHAKILAPTKQVGFYRCFLAREKIRMLTLNGINFYSTLVFMRNQLGYR